MSEVPLYLSAPIRWARALSRSKTDGFAPQIQLVNLGIVGELDGGRVKVFTARSA